MTSGQRISDSFGLQANKFCETSSLQRVPNICETSGSQILRNFRIGEKFADHALLDLGASVNLLPYLVYLELGLNNLKKTNVRIQLADRSVKIPRGIIEDVIVKIADFYYPVDFVVLDTQPTRGTQIPIILGRPFLATANAVINCRNGSMTLTFGNMKLEVNVFKLIKQPLDSDSIEEICLIESLAAHTFEHSYLEDPFQQCLAHFCDEFDADSYIGEVNTLLDSTPIFKPPKIRFEPLSVPATTTLETKKKPPKVELKPLPETLKYSYLGESDTFPMVIASDLTTHQET
ncbi:uncharacterized protein LOC132309076 [Cornus florida]|uniref:uncharacterized protein LOC132309076 n=1 Tax=Cornus florida TaxID=4283 RepID=UPI00289C56F7|nr:uncharacterized protein LOC132309076 [Cornus florida]